MCHFWDKENTFYKTLLLLIFLKQIIISFINKQQNTQEEMPRDINRKTVMFLSGCLNNVVLK